MKHGVGSHVGPDGHTGMIMRKYLWRLRSERKALLLFAVKVVRSTSCARMRQILVKLVILP